MLLVEITISGTVHRVSNQDIPLTHLWKAEIASFDEMRVKMDKTGGYAKPDYGDIEFLPSLFTDDWEPPTSCAITASYTETTEEAAVTLFTGTAHLKSIARDAITYSLYKTEFDYSVDGQAFSDTLVNVFTWACDATRLNLTLDSTNARSTSPGVIHTTGDTVLVDSLSDIAEFFSHYFTIEGDTLTLVDMLYEGTETVKTEFDFFSAEYDFPTPFAKFKSGDFSIDGSHAYGKEYSTSAYHTAQANVEAALADIKTLEEKAEAQFTFPISAAPSIGDFVTILNESLEQSKTTTALIFETTFDFDTDECTATGIVI